MKDLKKKKGKKQFVVIGLGRFGRSVAVYLEMNGCDVMAIDEDEKKVNAISEYVTSAMCLDISNEEAVKELGLSNFDGAVVSIVRNLEKAVLATFCLKEYGISQVIVEAYDEMQGKILTKVGADQIIYPEHEMGLHIANTLAYDNFLDLIELSEDYTIADIKTPAAWVGKNLIELNLRAKYDVNIIAIKNQEDMKVTPSADVRLKEDDILMILGENDTLKKLSGAI